MSLPDVVKCIADLAGGRSVRVISGEAVYDLPEVCAEPQPEPPPANPLATLEQTIMEALHELRAVREGQTEIVTQLRKPVIPKYDGHGKLIAAQRED